MMDNSDDYLTKSQDIRRLANLPPDQLADHLSTSHQVFNAVAPNLASHLYETATNAIQFLNQKLPNAAADLPQDQPLPPSKAEQHKWLDLHSFVNDPLSTFDRIDQGTFNSGHLSALQTIYPQLHQEISQKMGENLGTFKLEKKQLPYEKRIAMSQFIGQPLDSTLTPGSMQAILKAAAPNTGPAAQEAQGSQKTSGTTLTQLNKVNALSQTPLQARAAQKVKS